MINLLIPSYQGAGKLVRAALSAEKNGDGFHRIFISINGNQTNDLALLEEAGLLQNKKIMILETGKNLDAHMHLANCMGKLHSFLSDEDYLFTLCHDDIWEKNTDWGWLNKECKNKSGSAFFPLWSLVTEQGDRIKDKTFFEGRKAVPEEAVFGSIDQDGTFTNLSGIGLPFATWKDVVNWCRFKKSAARIELMLATHRSIRFLEHMPGCKIQVEVSESSDGVCLTQKQITWDEVIFYAWLYWQGRVANWQNLKTAVRKIWANLKYLAKLYCPKLYRAVSLRKMGRAKGS